MRTICALFLVVALAACGTNSTTPPVHDLAMNNQQPDLSTTSTVDMTTNSTDDGSTMETPDMTLCQAPGKLFPPKNPGDLYCPFGKTDAGSLYCKGGTTHCCEPSMGTSTCELESTPCAQGDTDWICDDPSDCPAQMVCCGSGTLVMSGNQMCANYATGFHGTHCAASCMQNEIQMCTSNGECSNNQMCIPFKTKGNQVGGCG